MRALYIKPGKGLMFKKRRSICAATKRPMLESGGRPLRFKNAAVRTLHAWMIGCLQWIRYSIGAPTMEGGSRRHVGPGVPIRRPMNSGWRCMTCRFPSREFSSPLLPCIFWTILLLSTPLWLGLTHEYIKKIRKQSYRDRGKLKGSDCHSEELFFSGAGKNFSSYR
jgi:hypothetical protein